MTTTQRKGKRGVKAWECVLCRTKYGGYDGEDHAGACLWIHIFRKDMHYTAMMDGIPPPLTSDVTD